MSNTGESRVNHFDYHPGQPKIFANREQALYMDKFRVGIIGVGGIANGKHMPSLAKLPHVEMVAFCDIIEERAQEGEVKYGTPGADVYTDYRKLLERKDIDVVHIYFTNKWHAEMTVCAGVRQARDVRKADGYQLQRGQRHGRRSKTHQQKLTIGYQAAPSDSMYLKQYIEEGGRRYLLCRLWPFGGAVPPGAYSLMRKRRAAVRSSISAPRSRPYLVVHEQLQVGIGHGQHL